MRIGTSNMLYWSSSMTQSQVIQQGIERMLWAEELGFDSAWLTEHHFANDPAYKPFGLDNSEFLAYDLSADSLAILSHVAAKTTTLRLGTGVVVLHYDNPIRVAERAALVDIMSGGRLELGVGRGGGHLEPKVFQVPKAGNRDRFGEALDIVRLALTGKPMSYNGTYYQVPEVIVTPKPVQEPFPLYVAASGLESFAWVGKQGLPFCYAGGAWGKSGWDNYRNSIDAYFDGAREAGVDTSTFNYPQIVFAYCDDTDAKAEDVARRHIVRHRRFSEGHYENRRYSGGIEGSGPPDLPADPTETFDSLARDVIDCDIIGSPETCIRKLQAYIDFFKPNYLLFSMGFGVIPHDQVRKSMERISRYVLPVLADQREPAGSR